MVIPITTLWLPILVAAVLVFVMSSIIHMFMNYHRNDFAKLSEEDRVMEALRPFNIPPGDYVFPFAGGMEAMKSEAYQQKVAKGPVAFVTVLQPGAVFNMGSQLTQWFFRVTGTAAFACYSMALMQRSIWWSQNWPATLKSMFDGLLYALLTAGAFGWLWPD